MKKGKNVMAIINAQVQGWEKNGRPIFDRPSVLKLISTKDRTPEVVAYVLGKPTVFNIPKEMEYIPMNNIAEEDLIKIVLDFPKLLSPTDIFGMKQKIVVPEERRTRPVLVAFALGKEELANSLAKSFHGSHSGLSFPTISGDELQIILKIANNVAERERKEEFSIEELVQLIKEETEKFSQETEKCDRITSRDIAEAAMVREIPTSNVIEALVGIDKTRGGGTDRDD